MLALAIGGCTVAELQDRMGYQELTQWMALYQQEPFGELRQDLRNAQLMALLANIHRDPKVRAFGVRDFMPDYWQEMQQAGPSLAQKFRALTMR